MAFDWFLNLFKPKVVVVQAPAPLLVSSPHPLKVETPTKSLNATQVSDSIVAFTKQQEGLVLEAMADVDGVYVLGYGCKQFDGKAVVKGQKCTADAADRNCRAKLQQSADAIRTSVKNLPLTQGQLDALADFVYNVGLGAFQSSTILRTILAKQPVTEDMFTRWNKIHKGTEVVELPALTLRRKGEYKFWML